MKVITVRPNGTRKVATINDPKEVEHQNQQQAVQDQRDDCDVNVILARAMKNKGQIPIESLNKKTGVYGDFSQNIDYQGSLDSVIQLNDQFGKLPAKIREKFKNDPQNLVDYLGDKDKLEESYKLGLRIKPAQPKPDLVVDGLGKLTETVNNIKEHFTGTTKPNKKT